MWIWYKLEWISSLFPSIVHGVMAGAMSHAAEDGSHGEMSAPSWVYPPIDEDFYHQNFVFFS